MKNILIIFCVISATAVQAQTQKSKVKTPVSKVKVKTTATQQSIDSFSYAIGVNVAANLNKQGINKIDLASLEKAMNDVFQKKNLLLTPEQCNMTIQQKLETYVQAAVNTQKEQGKKFLAENKKRPGVVELPNGLQYEVIKMGTGEKPKATDTVKANYIGTLINGQEFDNSYKRGEPLQIAVNAVIPGWTQALQLMPVGSKWKLYIPSDLGYGERGGGPIPGGATLIFEIELLGIVHSNK